MPAKVPNPRKQFQFNIIIPGFDPFLAQEVKTPDQDFDSTEHGDTGFLVKTAGMVKFGNLTVTQIFHSDRLDLAMSIWSKQILDTRVGGGQRPSIYKKNIIIEEYGNDGITVVNREVWTGCWPVRINGKELSRRGSDNTVRTLEFSVDEQS